MQTSIIIEENSQFHLDSSCSTPIEINSLQPIKCPLHQTQDIVFICTLESCENKMICHKCIEEDIKFKKKHLISHDAHLIYFSEEELNNQLRTLNTKISKMEQLLQSKEVVYLQSIQENLLESEFFKNLLENETEEIHHFSEKVLEDFKNGYKEYSAKLLPIFQNKISGFLEEIAGDFIKFRKKYQEIEGQIKKIQEINQNSAEVDCFETVKEFFTTLQHNNRVISDQILWNELQMIIEKFEAFSFLEQNNFLKNEFFSNVLNEIMTKFSKNLLIFSIPIKEKEKPQNKETEKQKEKEKPKEKENHRSKEKEEKKSCEMMTEMDKRNEDNKYQKPTNRKRKKSRSPSNFSSNSNRSNSHTKLDKKMRKKTYVADFLRKDPFVLDIPYLLLNDFCIVGPLREEEMYLVACSNNELFISVWFLNQNDCAFHTSLYGHTKKPFRLLYNDNRKMLISAGMEWIIKVWDVLTWSLLSSFTEDYGPIQCLSFNPVLDVTASYHDNTIKIWTTENKQIKIYSSFTCPIFNPQEILFFSEETTRSVIKANYIVIGNFEGNLYFYLQDEKNNFVNKKITKKHKGAIYKLFYNKIRNVVISSGSEDNIIFFWEVGKFEMIQSFAMQEIKRIRGISNQTECEHVIFSSGMDELFFYDINKSKLVGSYYGNSIEFMECVGFQTKNRKIVVSFAKDQSKKNYYCIKVIYFENK